jgi:hypothetical protein
MLLLLHLMQSPQTINVHAARPLIQLTFLQNQRLLPLA